MNAHRRLLQVFLAAACGLAACDGKVSVFDSPEDDVRIEKLEERVDRIERNLSGLEETTYVHSENGQVVMKLNMATAVVIVFAITGLVVLLVVWMRLHFARSRKDEEMTEGAP